MILTRSLAAVSLLALTALVALPFARAHFAWRDLADAYIHLVRIYAVGAALERGALYPRWLSDLYLGYGYPLLNFYAPATYYLGALLDRAGMTVYGSLQAMGALSVALGASGTYLLVRGIAPASRMAAGVGAAAYLLAPYPFLTNLYVRAAVPELLALGLLPWLFCFADRAVRGSRSATLLLRLSGAAIVLTHNVTALITLPLLGIWLIIVILSAAEKRARLARRLTSSIVTALALSAFFWLPALAESEYVQLDLLRGGIYEPRTWLFDPLAAFYRADYPHTFVGPADLALRFDYAALDRGVPPKPSLPQLVSWLLAAFTALVHLTRRSTRAALTPLTWLGLAAVCWCFNTTWSALLWDHAPLLPATQFPWRFYGPAALCCALAAATALATWRSGLARRAVHAGGAALVALFAINALSLRPLVLAPDPPHDVDARVLAAEEYDRYGAGTTGGGEFLPRTAEWDTGSPRTRRGIRVYDDLFPQAGWQAGLVRVVSGQAAVTDISHGPARIAAEVEVDQPATLGFHQLLFPGWRGYVDGISVPLQSVPRDAAHGVSLGFMTLPVPPGPHHVEIAFGTTPARTLGAALSAAGLAGVVLSLWPFGAIRIMLVAAVAAVCAAGWLELAARRPCCPAPSAARVAADLGRAVKTDAARTTTPIGRGSGAQPPYLEPRFLTIGADTRHWLFMHPPSEAAIDLDVPPGAYLQTALALDPATWDQATGDGVRFLAEIEIDGRRVSLVDRTLDPQTRLEDRRWVDVWADLSAYAGRRIQLTLRTEPRADSAYDWAGWAHPQVVLWRAARPHPAEPHPW